MGDSLVTVQDMSRSTTDERQRCIQLAVRCINRLGRTDRQTNKRTYKSKTGRQTDRQIDRAVFCTIRSLPFHLFFIFCHPHTTFFCRSIRSIASNFVSLFVLFSFPRPLNSSDGEPIFGLDLTAMSTVQSHLCCFLFAISYKMRHFPTQIKATHT